MVRVMSIYHFSSQHIQQLSIEELSAACMISDSEIALARASDHTIELRPLSDILGDYENIPDVAIKSFSSVDDVKEIIYSKVGNYILTLESRMSNYERAEIRYVRIYANWDTKQSSPNALRARIAGKITPMKKTLEMLELPLNLNPTSIACCQTTGNILVNHKNIIQIFLFKYCTNETTKLQYIDFFEAPFNVELVFEPLKVLFCEDIVSCYSKQYFHVFKITESIDEKNSTTSESNICTSTEMPQTKESTFINLDSDVDFQTICDKAELNGNSFNVKIKSTQESSIGSYGDDDSEMRPSVVNELNAVIKYLNNLPDSFAVPSKFTTQNLLQLKLQSMKISGVLRENVDTFKCMFVKPLYAKIDYENPKCRNMKNSSFFMHSKFKENFYGVAVLITTQQDGYLYQINTTTSTEFDASKCFLNVYPFTSNVVDVYFNDNVMHALCENGIESYTIRIGQKILQDYGCREKVYKNLSNTISLVNLRPFMNVHFMIPGDENLVLLANTSSTYGESLDETINWTIYNLKYPSIETIYEDFKEFADKSLRKYPNAYMNLLEEVHVMVRTNSMIAKLEQEDNSESGSEVKLVWNNCEALLEEASLVLADCLILNSNNFQQSLMLYEMAKLDIVGILQRFLNQNQIFQPKPIGLIEVMKISFLQLSCDSRKYDEIFASSIDCPQTDNNERKSIKFGNALIELFKRFAPKEIAQLNLESTVFRDYMDEKIHEFLLESTEKSIDDILCIILHLLKKDEVTAANSLLAQIHQDDLYRLLTRHWNIFFEFSSQSTAEGDSGGVKRCNKSIISFSDFTELLFLTSSTNERGELFTDVLMYHFFNTKTIRFNGILKLFMEYLASQFGHDSYIHGQNILKMMLEKYLLKYYESKSIDADISLLSSTSSGNTATLSASIDDHHRGRPDLSWNNEDLNSGVSSHRHAMRVLVRIYLSQLKTLSMQQEKKSSQDSSATRINKSQLIKVIDEMSSSLFINQKPVTKFDKIAEILIQNAGQNPILFLDERFRYLDWMPPFENLLQVLNNAEDVDHQYDFKSLDKDMLMTLIKLQALLCSGEVTSEITKEVLSYLQSNRENLIGHDSLLILLLPLHQALDLIIKNNPQCVLEYARCHFKLDNDWSYLITSLQRKANEFEVNDANMGHIFFYHRLLKETLEYVATSKPLDTVLKIFPEEKNLINRELFAVVDSKHSNSFDEYLKICVDRERSDKIKKMIESTGVQLYEAINKN
ncbi:CLUMA_CG018101, isoform A [Clunio marinus]|uniref:CLUMA_CG018101, isoform A n=1 Tax=Clunio marinus TaxID=568069 RepID=A0A1J1IYT6_9DIPT|nr:CLUMA_CG018101, isoform A [Clunio marinus]